MVDSHAHSFDRPDDGTIARYLSGTCKPAERTRVEGWAAAAPEHRAELAALRTAWTPPAVAEADPDDQMWHWIAAQMDEPLPRPTVVGPREVSRSSYSRFGAIAAALLLVVGGTILFRLPRHTATAKTSALVVKAMRELVTPRGARANSNLPDGSRVILGPDSRLQIPVTFAAVPSIAGVRDVYLQGEAFFEVTHDSIRPFRVHTANGIVEDVGTEFVVTAYPETGTTRAVVASGILTLRNRADTGRGLTLGAGDIGRVDAAGGTTLTRNANVAAYVGWTNGILAFDEVPLREAITTLSRWYGWDIQVTDTALARRHFTATFHDEPISHVLRALEIALGVRVERVGQTVILRPH